MKGTKTIKFIAPSRLSTTGKDDFLNKLKPVLGQNQIALPVFVNDFNQKTHFLSDRDPIEVSVKLLRKADKSFLVRVGLPGVGLLRRQTPATAGVCWLQDLLRLEQKFFHRQSNRILSEKEVRARARTLLSCLATPLDPQ